jgi:hypothetical protein
MNNNLPDWISRNNSPERLSLLKSSALAKSDFDIQDHEDPGNWGIMAILPNGHVQVLSMGGTQEQAEEFADLLLEDKPEMHLEIFECWTYNP